MSEDSEGRIERSSHRPFRSSSRRALSRASGFRIFAEDGLAGWIEFPLERPDGEGADHLVARTSPWLWARHPIIPAALVAAIDNDRQVVYVECRRAQIRRLPESIPFLI
jgi:hypothetical protein